MPRLKKHEKHPEDQGKCFVKRVYVIRQLVQVQAAQSLGGYLAQEELSFRVEIFLLQEPDVVQVAGKRGRTPRDA